MISSLLYNSFLYQKASEALASIIGCWIRCLIRSELSAIDEIIFKPRRVELDAEDIIKNRCLRQNNRPRELYTSSEPNGKPAGALGQ